MATMRITDLRLRTVIGVNDWEREHKQDIVINIAMEFDPQKACTSDNIKDTVDYKSITKRIIKEVETTHFLLLEKLTDMILKIVLENPKVEKATVRVDKPFALRFADSVSIELNRKRNL
jgi:FolB domain-containing protein